MSISRMPPLANTGTPLVLSRSLGALLGLRTLAFKLESMQPTGSWLDRSAARIVADAISEAATGVCVVDADAVAVALASACARAALPLVLLLPRGDRLGDGATGCHTGHLDALGVRVVSVQATRAQLDLAAPGIASAAGLRLVSRTMLPLATGLLEVVQEIAGAGQPGQVLAMPLLAGDEARWLAATSTRKAAVPLPLDLPDNADPDPLLGVLGVAAHQAPGMASSPGVLCQVVTTREGAAARRLLAEEEGILTSAGGALGLAALIRARQADLQLRPRARQLPMPLDAVVIVTGGPYEDCQPSPASADLLPAPVSLADVQGSLRRALMLRH
ncbi:MAG: pyridoxal-phosphate dependent enzyme [Chloroflexota bacterium]